MSSAASVDTCFIIDWAHYRRAELLERIFDSILLTEHVLREVKSERTITLITGWLSKGKAYIVPITPSIEKFARELISYAIHEPRIPRVDEPEIYGLAIAREYKVPLLTENKGAIRLASYHQELKGIKVMRAIEVLSKLIEDGVINAKNKKEIEDVFVEYAKDTHHYFPEEDLFRTIEKLLSKR
ncbi:MAG: hypothetical protein ACP5KW_04270 [Thermoproteota archaeon]|jgi:predicted nucleic acid-binding protein